MVSPFLKKLANDITLTGDDLRFLFGNKKSFKIEHCWKLCPGYTGMPSGSWASQQSFLLFTLASQTFCFHLKEICFDMQHHSLMNKETNCNRQLSWPWQPHCILTTWDRYLRSFSAIWFITWFTPSVIENLWYGTPGFS